MEELAQKLLEKSISEVPFVESLVNCTGQDITLAMNGDVEPLVLPGCKEDRGRLVVAKRPVTSLPLQRTLPAKRDADCSARVVSVPSRTPLRLVLPERVLQKKCQGIIVSLELGMAILAMHEDEIALLAGRAEDKSSAPRVPVYYWVSGQDETKPGAIGFSFRQV